MRSRRMTSRWWIVPMMVGAVMAMPLRPGATARADDTRAFCGKTLDGWIRLLRHGTARERTDAAWMLSYFGPEARKAVPDLIDDLRRAGDVRHEPGAVRALGKIGPDAAPAVPLLIPGYLAEGCNLARMGTFLGGNGGMPGEALIGIGAPAVPALIDVLTGPNTEMRACTAMHLADIGPPAKAAVPALVGSLRADQPVLDDAEAGALRHYAIVALGRIGPEAREAGPALNGAVKSRHVVPARRGLFGMEDEAIDYEGAAAAAQVLGGLGPEAKVAIPALIDVLRDRVKDGDNWEVRREAALALGRLGPGAEEAIPVLRRVVDEGPPPMAGGMIPMQVSDAAVVALFHLAPDGKDLAERWAERSTSPERKATLLGAVGRKSYEAELLSRIWVDDLNGVLAQGEHEGDETLFVESYFERLGRLGVGGEAAIPRLEELARHRNPWIRQWAGETLEQITKGKTGPAGP